MSLSRSVELLKDCLIALIEFIEVIRRRRYDNPKEDDNTYIYLITYIKDADCKAENKVVEYLGEY